ncbi:snaclec 5-like [Haliotis rubra]|uniref:snaclec 5-like n=1 Tax=Haliotis rubra TaxID=36100 RepID=UPI001EE57E04|nr:snaclec 5-like [Haliotis rubra]
MSCFPCLSVNFILGFTRLIPSDAIPVNVSVSRVECASMCLEDIRCNSFFYDKRDRYCYLTNTLKHPVYHRGELEEALNIRYYIIDKARGCKADNGYDFSRLSGQCYKYYTETKEWTDAQQECASAGANLIPIHDDKTRDLMRTLISNEVIWIGLNDIASEHSWVWADGSALTSNYWNPGEPLTSRGSNCVSYYPHIISGGWDDVSCNNKYRFVCEYRLL